MDDNKEAVTKEGEVETPQTESPTVETQTTADVAESAEKPEQTPQQTTEPEVETPQGKAFAEMRHRIKELESALNKTKSNQNVFENLMGGLNQTTPQVRVNPQDYVDPTTGAFNQVGYESAIRTVANQEARSAAMEEIDKQRAVEKHPELTTDPDFANDAVALWWWEKVNGKPASLEKIADKLAKSKNPQALVEKAKREAETKVKTQLTEKEQASLSATGRMQPGQLSQDERNSLRERARSGDDWALAELMKKGR